MNTSTKIILWSVLAIFLIVLFAVDLNRKNKNRQQNTQKLVTMAVLVALSVIMLLLIRFPIFPSAAFLEYDPADIPIFLGTFAYGPLAGFALTVVAAIIQGMTVSASSGFIGIMMHVFATGSFVLVAGNWYQRHKTKKQAVVALVLGCLVWTVSMMIWNYFFTPIFMGMPRVFSALAQVQMPTRMDTFMGMPRAAVAPMIFPVIVPFNLIKSSVNSVITFLLYKRFSNIRNLPLHTK